MSKAGETTSRRQQAQGMKAVFPERRSDEGDRRWHDTFTARQHAEEGLREGPYDRRKSGEVRNAPNTLPPHPIPPRP